MNWEKILLKALHYVMGFIFLWAFLDKVFGLGFSTAMGKGWLAGISPTYGYLTYVSKGPLMQLFRALAGKMFVDWLFMLSLLFIGLSLLSGKYLKQGYTLGMGLLFLMYLTVLPPVNNPIVDEHIVYILVMGLLYIKRDEV